MGEPAGESSKKRRRRKRSKGGGAADAADADATADANESEPSAKVKEEDGDAPSEDVDDSKAAADDADGAEATGDAVKADEDGEAKEGKKRKRKRKRKQKAGAEDANNDDTPPTDSDAAKLQSVEHTVFVEGLPFTSTEADVRAFFASHGCGDILQLRLPTWQDSGRLRGFGHVVFASPETRARALSDAVNGQDLGGRYVTVKEAHAPRAGTTAGASLGGRAREQPPGCKTVFVKNLPYEASEEQILDAFRACGKVVDGGVRVARNHVSGTSKGFAYVEYKQPEGALAAVQKAAKPFGLTVLKRPVFVDYDEGSMKGSFRDRDGRLWSKGHGDGGGRGAGGRGGGGGGRGGRGRGPGFGMRGR